MLQHHCIYTLFFSERLNLHWIALKFKILMTSYPTPCFEWWCIKLILKQKLQNSPFCLCSQQHSLTNLPSSEVWRLLSVIGSSNAFKNSSLLHNPINVKSWIHQSQACFLNTTDLSILKYLLYIGEGAVWFGTCFSQVCHEMNNLEKKNLPYF